MVNVLSNDNTKKTWFSLKAFEYDMTDVRYVRYGRIKNKRLSKRKLDKVDLEILLKMKKMSV